MVGQGVFVSRVIWFQTGSGLANFRYGFFITLQCQRHICVPPCGQQGFEFGQAFVGEIQVQVEVAFIICQGEASPLDGFLDRIQAVTGQGVG